MPPKHVHHPPVISLLSWMVEKWLHQQLIATLVLWSTCQMNQRIGYMVAGLWAKSLMFCNNPPGKRHWNWLCPERGIFASGSDVILSLCATPDLISSSLSGTANGCNMRIIKWHGVSHEGFYTLQPKSKNVYTSLSLHRLCDEKMCI